MGKRCGKEVWRKRRRACEVGEGVYGGGGEEAGDRGGVACLLGEEGLRWALGSGSR